MLPSHAGLKVGPYDPNMEMYHSLRGTPRSKKMYSVEFLLKFQYEQTEPPEKIKLFSEIYMPSGVHDNALPMPASRGHSQRTGTGRGKKGAAAQSGDRADYFGSSSGSRAKVCLCSTV